MADSDPIEWLLYDTDLVTKLAILPVAQSHLYLEFQEPGSGEIRIPLDSAAAALVASGQFIVCRYRGSDRGGFFVDNIKQIDADGSEGSGRWLSISGRGPLAILDDAIVWQDGSGATVRAFVGQTKAYILKTLIDEAVTRGALAELDYDFDATTSSDAAAWTDSEDYDIEVGKSLLDLLRMFAKTGEIEFGATLQGGAQPILLSAYKNGIGSDKSDTVYFRIGSNCEEVSTDERGDEIKNVILTKYKDGYIVNSNATSITNRRRRETHLSLEQAQSSDSASTYAAAQLDNQKDPKTSVAVRVYDGVSPNLFLDYILGDTVTVDKFGVENSRRVLGIQADFDGDRPANVVCEMDTLFYDNELRTRNDLDDLLNRWSTARDNDLGEVREWLSIGNPDGPVYALLHSGNYLYVGGDFSNITGRLTTENIARYNTSTGAWEAMASGITTGAVVAIVEHGGDIYAATETRVYHWTGGAWSLIGTTTGIINAMASFGSNLYVGGVTISFDSGVTSSVMYWDGSAPWISSLAWLHECHTLGTYNGDLYGGFDTSTANGLRRLNSGAWSTVLVTPTNGTTVKALLEVGDYLYYAGGASGTARVYRWDGASASREDLFSATTWGDPGGSTSDILAAYLSDIYFGSDFTHVDGNAGYGNIVRYSGGIFNDLLDGTSTAVGDRINALAVDGSDVYAGGVFTTVGGKSITNLAVWVTSFRSLVQHLSNGATFDMGAAIHQAAASAVTDNDEFPFWEDTAQGLRKITWANIKSTLQTFFNSVYARLAAVNVFTRQQQIVNATNGEGGAYIETIGDAYTLDAEQYTVGDNVTSPVHFLYRQSSGAGNITAPMILGQQADSGAGTITGPWLKFEHEGTEEAILEKGGSLRLRLFLDLLEGSAPSSPATSRWRLYAKTDGLYYKDDAGVEIGPLGSGAGGSGHTIKDEGTPLTNRAGLNFVGGGVTVTDDAGNNETDVTIPDVATQVMAAAEKTSFSLTDHFALMDDADSDLLKRIPGNYLMNSIVSHLDSAGYLPPDTTALYDFQLGDGTGAWYKAPLAEVQTLLTAVSGWIPVSDTWTRTGNHIFTVSGDVTATYRKGAKVRYKDGGSYEYGVIGASSYSAPNTTITLITNASYTMAAATITDKYISYIENPEGWPQWFTWTPSITNFTATTLTGKWRVSGRQIFWEFFSLEPTITATPILTLPVALIQPSGITRQVVGSATFLEAGVAAYPGWVLRDSSNTTATMRAVNASATYASLSNLSSTVPFAWGTGDECNAQGNYEF